MAKRDKQNPNVEKEKPLADEAAAAEATNGTPPDDLTEAEADVARAYEETRRELGSHLDRLRREMAQFDAAQASQRARTWVEDNPTLAVFLALGAGIVAGKLLTAAFRPPPPPSLGERIRRQSNQLARQAKGYAHDVGGSLEAAGSSLARRAETLTDTVSVHARDLGETVARRAETLAAVAAEQAAELGESVAEQSVRAARGLQSSASDAAGTVRDKASSGYDFAESALGAAKTVLAAVVVKKVSDFLRRVA